MHLDNSHPRVKNKNFSGDLEESNEVPGVDEKIKSFTLTIPWNLTKPVKIFPGKKLQIDTTQIGNKWDYLKSSAQSKRRYLCCICYNKTWMKIDGQISWKIYDLMGSAVFVTIRPGWKLMDRFHGRSMIWWEDLPMKDVLDNHYKDRLFHLTHWVSITLSLRRISQESINLERKSYLVFSSNTYCARRQFGRVTYWSQTFRSWRRWTYRKSTRKDSIRKSRCFPKKKENLFFHSQMEESNLLMEINKNIHLDTGTVMGKHR